MTENPVGDQIRHLNQARCLRIQKKRDFGKVAKLAAGMPDVLEHMREGLDFLLIIAFVEDDQAALGVLFLVKRLQIAIKTRSHLLEAPSQNIVRREELLFDDAGVDLQLQLLV